MQVKDPSIPLKGNAKDTVLSFLTAINNEDFSEAREYLNDDMTFDGVLGARNGAEDYLQGMEELKFKFDIVKAFVDETDVVVLYNVDMRGKKVFTCGWYKTKDGKISSIKVVFDPRPVL